MINIVKGYGVCFVDCRKIDEGIDCLFALREINALCLKLSWFLPWMSSSIYRSQRLVLQSIKTTVPSFNLNEVCAPNFCSKERYENYTCRMLLSLFRTFLKIQQLHEESNHTFVQAVCFLSWIQLIMKWPLWCHSMISCTCH